MTETCAEIGMFVVRVVHILRNPVCRPPCGETRRTAVIGCRFPAVVTADLRLAEPRYVTLPSMAKARKKPVETIELASLGIHTAPRQKLLSVEPPPARKAGVMVANVDELIQKLRDEAHLL